MSQILFVFAILAANPLTVFFCFSLLSLGCFWCFVDIQRQIASVPTVKIPLTPYVVSRGKHKGEKRVLTLARARGLAKLLTEK